MTSSGHVANEAIMAYIPGREGMEPGDGGDSYRLPKSLAKERLPDAHDTGNLPAEVDSGSVLMK